MQVLLSKTLFYKRGGSHSDILMNVIMDHIDPTWGRSYCEYVLSLYFSKVGGFFGGHSGFLHHPELTLILVKESVS